MAVPLENRLVPCATKTMPKWVLLLNGIECVLIMLMFYICDGLMAIIEPTLIRNVSLPPCCTVHGPSLRGADCCFVNASFEPQPPKNTGKAAWSAKSNGPWLQVEQIQVGSSWSVFVLRSFDFSILLQRVHFLRHCHKGPVQFLALPTISRSTAGSSLSKIPRRSHHLPDQRFEPFRDPKLFWMILPIIITSNCHCCIVYHPLVGTSVVLWRPNKSWPTPRNR